jgi:hypothetical protein
MWALLEVGAGQSYQTSTQPPKAILLKVIGSARLTHGDGSSEGKITSQFKIEFAIATSCQRRETLTRGLRCLAVMSTEVGKPPYRGTPARARPSS